jgi:glutamate dehydrogenase/leucine dehydrogenase
MRRSWCGRPAFWVAVIVAVHSTVLGPAVGGCRVWRYAGWRDGLEDALRLSAGMTRKCAVAGLANGGGKTVVAVPGGSTLGGARRIDVLRDVGDAIASLGGRYATGPDVGTTPEDMVVIGERTGHVFCRPAQRGGSGDSSPHTATGVVAALRAICARIYGSPDLGQRRLAIVGLGRVGGHLVRQLAAAGADLLVSDIDPGIYALAVELGKDAPRTAAARVQAIGGTVGLLLDSVERTGADLTQAALELAGQRLSAAGHAGRQPASHEGRSG